MEKIKIPLKCQCSQVQGYVHTKPQDGNNVVCFCDDCQAFAQFLGNPQNVLTENNGTELFQITPNKLKLTQGKNNLACMQLSPKGLKRWYTSCCKTPVANTMNGKIAFNGIIQKFIDFDALDISKQDAIGEVSDYCMSRFAKGELPENSHPKYPLGITIKIFKMILLGYVFKTYRPNEFFSEETGEPVIAPVVLTKEQRDEIMIKVNMLSDED
ncbi:MAG: hypothetical protein HON90_12255 [Halobacteriovoraceae bacterium]|jgi:hypothetical protein|nr:hypothetical protein [Halobacteriovoraceae bacterium]